MSPEKLSLSAAIVALLVGSIQYARAKKDPDGAILVGFLGVIIVALVWIPPRVSDWLLAAGALLAVLAASRSVAWIVAVAVVLYGLRRVSPHGVFAAVVALMAVFTALAALGYRDTLARLSRGRELKPGERPDGDVEVTGHAMAQPNTFVPGHEGRCAFWVVTENDTKRFSGEYVTLATAAGPVRVRLADAVIDRITHAKSLTEEAASDAARLIGLPDADAVKSLEVRWVEADTTMYVTGSPEWETAPVECGGYRDSPLVPVFRKRDEEGPYLFEGTEDDARALNRASVAQCLALTACFSAVAVARVMGWLQS